MEEKFKSSGHVKWFNDLQGFGIIVDESSGDEVFVHHTAIRSPGASDLHEGQHVRFEAFSSERGFQACMVRPSE